MTSTRRVGVAAVVVLAALAAALSTFGQPKPKAFSSFDPQVKPLLAQMTLEEKIGQTTHPEQSAWQDPSEVETLLFGSVLSGGNSYPKAGNSLQAWTDLYDRLQASTKN